VDVALTLNRIPLGNSLVAEASINSIGGVLALIEFVGNIRKMPNININIDAIEFFFI
jgi:hypothetical protein